MTARILVSAISAEAISCATHTLHQLLCCAQADIGAFSVGSLHTPSEHDGRMPLLGFTRMLGSAAEQSGRSQLGLDMAAFEGAPTHSIFGDLFTYAPTLGDALDALSRYFPVSQTDTTVRLTQANGQARLSYQILDPAVGDRLHDAAYTLGKLCRSIRRGAGVDWQPDQVNLAGPTPRVREPYRRYFRAPVVFDAPVSELHFASRTLERPIATADPVRYQRFCAQLERQMPRQQEPRLLREALRTWMTYATREGKPSLEHAAADFGVTPRTLQRRLKEQRIGFQDLLAQVRMEKARCMLAESRIPVTAIAHELGFSETSAFTRAFRNRIQLSPRAFRRTALSAA